MLHILTNAVITIVMLGLLGGPAASRTGPPEKTSDLRKLLMEMSDVRVDSDRLVKLLRVGDRRIAELIRLLDDPDRKVSLRAQVVIRYLGNEQGMKALREWYGRQQGEYGIAGPIPVPLDEWDYNAIKTDMLARPPQTWRELGVQYIYALALDTSPKAKTMLAEVIDKAVGLSESDFTGYAVKRIQTGKPTNLTKGREDLAGLALNNSFFIAPEDRKYTSARVLGFNEAKDKALIEVYVNRGVLAEEWFHVVLRRGEKGWQFSSITPVGVS